MFTGAIKSFSGGKLPSDLVILNPTSMYELARSKRDGVENAGKLKSILFASVSEFTGENWWYLEDTYFKSMGSLKKKLSLKFLKKRLRV